MSINNITYLSQFISYNLFIFSNYKFTLLYFADIIEVNQFLKSLEIDKTYVVTFELIMSELSDNDIPSITLSEPILITKLSNPILISKFILNQISLADEKFNLDYDLILNMRLNDKSSPYILIKYNEINLF
jgi:hypothetical protein